VNKTHTKPFPVIIELCPNGGRQIKPSLQRNGNCWLVKAKEGTKQGVKKDNAGEHRQKYTSVDVYVLLPE
jgi:hypothetical protein